MPNLGKFAACRCVARTVYLGSALTATAANRGIEDRRVKLCCVMPGESPAVFGDALRRLSTAATYLYQDGPRYWYSTQPTVTKVAEDRAEQLKRNPEAIAKELERRLRLDLRKTGDFDRVHTLPQSGQDVPDDRDTRLVVLGLECAHTKDPSSPAITAAKAILASRGNAPRLYQNTLVFLAVDQGRLQDLDEAVRRYLAWESIVAETESLDLTAHQRKQAESQKATADGVVTARLPEAYQWVLLPAQASPKAPLSWQAVNLSRVSNAKPLAVRASEKLAGDELFLAKFAGTRLRMELDKIPLWRGDHVAIKQLEEDFARYVYLARLKDPSVLVSSVRDGVSLLSWEVDTFGYADSFDEATSRYRGLRGGAHINVASDNPGLLVKPLVARKQIMAEEAARGAGSAKESVAGDPRTPSMPAGHGMAVPPAKPDPKPKRYHGTVALDSTRVGRDASRIADEVIAHLAGLVGAKVKVTLEIEAEIPSGAPDTVVRTVTENSRTLKFASQGFEAE